MATLVGTDGADFLMADAEHNILLGNAGNDTLNGGSVFAFAAYWSSPGPVGVQLFSESANDGFGSVDTLQNIHGCSAPPSMMRSWAAISPMPWSASTAMTPLRVWAATTS